MRNVLDETENDKWGHMRPLFINKNWSYPKSEWFFFGKFWSNNNNKKELELLISNGFRSTFDKCVINENTRFKSSNRTQSSEMNDNDQ